MGAVVGEARGADHPLLPLQQLRQLRAQVAQVVKEAAVVDEAPLQLAVDVEAPQRVVEALETPVSVRSLQMSRP